jgi:FkbM family methyltransferase
LGFKNVIKASSIFEFNLHHEPPGFKRAGVNFYLRNRSNIEACMQLMSDKLSKEVFYAIMQTYILKRPVKILSSSPCEQYFPSEINLRKGYRRFINCGSYDGDTVKNLHSKFGKIQALACFEPDEKNYTLLNSYLKANKNKIADTVMSFPCGVFDRETKLSFSNDKLLCSSIFDKGNSMIQCVALDNVIPDFKPTFISMDVEGAELDALRGARELICVNKPDLAISVYHFPNHIWEIPLYLNSLKLGYRFYLRNYTGFTYETILYASVIQ